MLDRKILILVMAAILVMVLPACSSVSGGTPAPAPTSAPLPSLAPSSQAQATLPPVVPMDAPVTKPKPLPTPSTKVVPTPAPSASAAAPLSVAAQTIVVDNKYVAIHTLYPLVSGMQDQPFEKDMNEKAKSDMQKRVQDLQDQAKAFYQEAKDKDFPFNKFSLDAALTVHTNDGALLSMTNRFYTYTGGAHGISGGIYTNVLNTQPARSLTLPQIFTDPAQGVARVNQQIKAQIAKGDYFFPDSFKTVDASTWFYITKTDLVVVFPEYAIAPYAAGEPEFKIPLSSLSGILIPGIPH